MEVDNPLLVEGSWFPRAGTLWREGSTPPPIIETTSPQGVCLGSRPAAACCPLAGPMRFIKIPKQEHPRAKQRYQEKPSDLIGRAYRLESQFVPRKIGTTTRWYKYVRLYHVVPVCCWVMSHFLSYRSFFGSRCGTPHPNAKTSSPNVPSPRPPPKGNIEPEFKLSRPAQAAASPHTHEPSTRSGLRPEATSDQRSSEQSSVSPGLHREAKYVPCAWDKYHSIHSSPGRQFR